MQSKENKCVLSQYSKTFTTAVCIMSGK